MRKTEIKLLKTCNVIIAFILAFLGYSCIVKAPMEYGSPHAEFIVKGKVVSSINSEPIENIQVIMNWDTTYTDISGNYQVLNTEPSTENETYTVKFNDLDGTVNGAFDNLDTVVQFIDPKFTNANGIWDKGETEKEVDIKLNPKK